MEENKELTKIDYGEVMLNDLKEQCYAIKVADHNDTVNHRKALDLHKIVSDKWNEIEKARKGFKKTVDVEAKVFLVPLAEMKNHLFTQKYIVASHERKLAADKLKKEQEDRDVEDLRLKKEREQLDIDKAKIEKDRLDNEREKQRLADIEKEKAKPVVEAPPVTPVTPVPEVTPVAQPVAPPPTQQNTNSSKDKETLRAFSVTLSEIGIPNVHGEDARKITNGIAQMLSTMQTYLNGKIDKL